MRRDKASALKQALEKVMSAHVERSAEGCRGIIARLLSSYPIALYTELEKTAIEHRRTGMRRRQEQNSRKYHDRVLKWEAAVGAAGQAEAGNR